MSNDTRHEVKLRCREIEKLEAAACLLAFLAHTEGEPMGSAFAPAKRKGAVRRVAKFVIERNENNFRKKIPDLCQDVAKTVPGVAIDHVSRDEHGYASRASYLEQGICSSPILAVLARLEREFREEIPRGGPEYVFAIWDDVIGWAAARANLDQEAQLALERFRHERSAFAASRDALAERVRTVRRKLAEESASMLLWKFVPPGKVFSLAIAEAGGLVFTSVGNGRLYALEASSGVKRWEWAARPDSWPPHFAASRDGMVLVGSSGSKLAALHDQTGAVSWESDLFCWAPLSITPDGTAYCIGTRVARSDEGMALWAIDLKSGLAKWKLEITGTYLHWAPVGNRNAVYFVDENLVACIQTVSPERESVFPAVLWTFGSREEFMPIHGFAVGSAGAVYAVEPEGRLTCIDAETGAARWQTTAGQLGATGSPVVGPDETIYCGSSEGRLFALDGRNGATKWVFEADEWEGAKGPDLEPPAIGADGTIFVGAGDMRLYALDSKTGSKKWAFLGGGEISSPSIGPDGTVYFSAADQGVYAIRTSCGGPAGGEAIPRISRS